MFPHIIVELLFINPQGHQGILQVHGDEIREGIFIEAQFRLDVNQKQEKLFLQIFGDIKAV